MRRRDVVAVLLLALGACTTERDTAAEKMKAPTQRERDSVLGQSKIPGATGVGRAMTVADSAGARVHLQDSLATSE